MYSFAVYAKCATSRRHVGTDRPALLTILLAHLFVCPLSYCLKGVFPYLNANDHQEGKELFEIYNIKYILWDTTLLGVMT